MGLFSGHAKDIEYRTKEEFFEAVGYLAAPGRVDRVEAQVPEDRTDLYERELPGQDYYTIADGETAGGNDMKYGIQLRIYLNTTNHAPSALKSCIVKGNRINRGLFIERLLRDFGFQVNQAPDGAVIRSIAEREYSAYLADFDRGYQL